MVDGRQMAGQMLAFDKVRDVVDKIRWRNR